MVWEDGYVRPHRAQNCYHQSRSNSRNHLLVQRRYGSRRSPLGASWQERTIPNNQHHQKTPDTTETHTLLVKELEGRKDLTKVSLGFAKDLLDGLIGRQGENGDVHGWGTTRAKDGDGSNYTDGSFGADEELLDVEAYDRIQILLYLLDC